MGLENSVQLCLLFWPGFAISMRFPIFMQPKVLQFNVFLTNDVICDGIYERVIDYRKRVQRWRVGKSGAQTGIYRTSRL